MSSFLFPTLTLVPLSLSLSRALALSTLGKHTHACAGQLKCGTLGLFGSSTCNGFCLDSHALTAILLVSAELMVLCLYVADRSALEKLGSKDPFGHLTRVLTWVETNQGKRKERTSKGSCFGSLLWPSLNGRRTSTTDYPLFCVRVLSAAGTK